MKPDIAYIVKILKAVADHPKYEMEQDDLLQAIGIDKDNEDDRDKFYYHMMRIEEAELMTSSIEGLGDSFGFLFLDTGAGMVFINANYELTLSGLKFLEEQRNNKKT
jgi:hypothetical protein